MTTRPRVLDELTLTVVVDNESDSLSSVDAGIPQEPERVSAMRRIPASRQYEGRDCVPVNHRLCVACHGFSVFATGRADDEQHSVLFDAGPYGDVWLENTDRLGIDRSAIEVVFLSHWHWDHSGALPVAVAAVTEARRAAGLSDPVIVDLHPDRPDQRGTLTPTGRVSLMPPEPTFAALEDAGGAIDRRREPHLVAGGFFLGSGRIPRTTAYETGMDGHLSFFGEEARPDPLLLDERFLGAEVRGRGVTVLSACSHAGVVNVCLAAGLQFPDAPIDLVLGGYHLGGRAMERRIEATVADLDTRVNPRVVAPGHCTGWRAKAAMAARFAPDRYAPSAVGTTYRLTACD